MKIFLACAFLSTAAATPALAEQFTRDGATYNYEVQSYPGYKVISGVSIDTGKSFRLVVKGARVSGRFGESAIQFRISEQATATASESPMVVAVK